MENGSSNNETWAVRDSGAPLDHKKTFFALAVYECPKGDTIVSPSSTPQGIARPQAWTRGVLVMGGTAFPGFRSLRARWEAPAWRRMSLARTPPRAQNPARPPAGCSRTLPEWLESVRPEPSLGCFGARAWHGLELGAGGESGVEDSFRHRRLDGRVRSGDSGSGRGGGAPPSESWRVGRRGLGPRAGLWWLHCALRPSPFPQLAPKFQNFGGDLRTIGRISFWLLHFGARPVV